MRQLSIFDGNERIAVISIIDGSKFLFARSSREWSDMKRLLDASEKLHEADSKIDVIDNLITMLHNFNYNTELINE